MIMTPILLGRTMRLWVVAGLAFAALVFEQVQFSV